MTDEQASCGDLFAPFDVPADDDPWACVTVVLPMAGLEPVLKAMEALGFANGPDWCEMRRAQDNGLVDYGPCPPPWKQKASGQ